MGTRSTIKFYEKYEKTKKMCIASIYQQYDGYPECVGLDLAEFLDKMTIGNGIGMDTDLNSFANGLGCMAAQYIAKIKDRVGGVYMTNEKDTQEYDYIVDYDYGKKNDENPLMITVKDYEEQLFRGDPKKFLAFCRREEQEEK